MSLFRYLADDAFLIFSRRHRFAYEAALLEVHERFFSSGAVFPTPQEIIHILYDLLDRRPDLIGDGDADEGLPEILSKGRKRLRFAGTGGETGDKALKFATQLYQGLARTGWLEEEEFGLRVTVDMPMGALLVVQRLASLKSDVSQRFGGLIVHVKASLDQVEKLDVKSASKTRGDAAHALRQARVQVDQFAQALRAILSDLRRIRKTLLEAEGLRQKMETYFEDFIGELVLKDFQSILTHNHPYRFRDQIIASARNIYADRERLSVVATAYMEQGLSPSAAADDDLLAIEHGFETVGEMFERISQFRRALETRLRNTVKYAEQGERGLGSRSRDLVRRLEHLLAQDAGRYETPTVPVTIEPVMSPWSPALLATPRQVAAPIQVRPLAARPFDPVYLARKRLKAEYLDRINPGVDRVAAFLRRKVPPFGTREARFVAIDDVDELLAFEAVRRFAFAKAVPGEIAEWFDIETAEDRPAHDSDWLECPNFIIRHSRPGERDAGRV